MSYGSLLYTSHVRSRRLSPTRKALCSARLCLRLRKTRHAKPLKTRRKQTPKYFSLSASPENQSRPRFARGLVCCCRTKLDGQILYLPLQRGSLDHRGKKNAVGLGTVTSGNIARNTPRTLDFTTRPGRQTHPDARLSPGEARSWEVLLP